MSEEQIQRPPRLGGGPAELPAEESVSHQGGVLHRPGGIHELPFAGFESRPVFPPRPGEIHELPAAHMRAPVASLIHEAYYLRARLQSVEAQLLAGIVRPGGIGGPAELPEGGEGGGGVIPIPHEIAELPVDITGLLAQIAVIEQRLATVETRVMASINELAQRVEALAKR